MQKSRMKKKWAVKRGKPDILFFCTMKTRHRPVRAGTMIQAVLPVAACTLIMLALIGLSFSARAQYYPGGSGTATVKTPPHPSPKHQRAAKDRTGNESNPVYIVVDKEPQFPGGNEALSRFLDENLKYPEEAKKKKTEGRVLVSFIVRSDGTTDKSVIEKGLGNGCDEEVLRLIKIMPLWIPGENGGKQVDVSYSLTVSFQLKATPEKK
jgi:TonB family protein